MSVATSKYSNRLSSTYKFKLTMKTKTKEELILDLRWVVTHIQFIFKKSWEKLKINYFR